MNTTILNISLYFDIYYIQCSDTQYQFAVTFCLGGDGPSIRNVWEGIYIFRGDHLILTPAGRKTKLAT